MTTSPEIIQSCVLRRDWQNLSNILGCSLDRARSDYDVTYMRPVSDEPKPAPVRSMPISAADVTRSMRVRSDNRVSRAWVLDVRRTIKFSGMTHRQFCESLGLNPGVVTSAMSPKGHMSPNMEAKVQKGIDAIKKAKGQV